MTTLTTSTIEYCTTTYISRVAARKHVPRLRINQPTRLQSPGQRGFYFGDKVYRFGPVVIGNEVNTVTVQL
jgi:hypothetical protein